MCLKIQDIDFNQNVSHKVYKVVTKKPGNTLHSTVFDYKWPFVGETAVSDRHETELGEDERELGEAWEGFHFFTSFEDAKRHSKRNRQSTPRDFTFDRFEILECEVQPEDYVAQGYWQGFPSVVYTKCKVLLNFAS